MLDSFVIALWDIKIVLMLNMNTDTINLITAGNRYSITFADKCFWKDNRKLLKAYCTVQI